ncbi:MAG: hypothetical protein PHS86_07750 [Syntrophaceae bacterium]|nr:hypothetical protein [Syntrophaceae bacterium]
MAAAEGAAKRNGLPYGAAQARRKEGHQSPSWAGKAHSSPKSDRLFMPV